MNEADARSQNGELVCPPGKMKTLSIIHFLDIKPIFTSYNGKDVYKQEFFNYLAMTPWKNFKQISGTQRKIR